MPQNVYSTTEIDAKFATINQQLGAINNTLTSYGARITALEQAGGTTPPIPPQPTPGGATYFTPTSSWNTKLSNPHLSTVSVLNQGGGWINAGDYGVPVYVSQPNDPIVTMNVPASWGWPAQTLQLRIKSGQGGATGTDGSLCVIDGNTGYDFWQFRRINDNSASCSAWAKCDTVNGTGWGQASPFQAAGIHATGSSTIAGLIMGNELTQGFHHAVAIAVRRNISSSQHVGEAINSDGDGGPIPEGTRVAISSTAPVTVTTQQGKMLWKALVDYGGFVIDVADGNPAIYFWADPLSVPAGDIQVLLDPSWTAAELAKINAVLQVVG